MRHAAMKRRYIAGLGLLAVGLASCTHVYTSSTLHGGTDNDEANGVVSEGGYTYVAGRTHSLDLPLAPPGSEWINRGHNDCFVAKFDGTGKLIWSLVLSGHDDDHCTDIAAYGGYLYVTGYTKSEDFPHWKHEENDAGGDYDAFVVKIEDQGQNGLPLWSNIIRDGLAGRPAKDDDKAYSISAANGVVAIVGQTDSKDFPNANCAACQLNGPYDAFLTLLSASNGKILLSDYIGGSGSEFATAVFTGGLYQPRVYVTGSTDSSDFPLSANAMQKYHKGGTFDAFVVAFQLNGAIDYATYYGGNGDDIGEDIAIDYNGIAGSPDVAIVVGQTESDNLGGSHLQHSYGGKTDGFILKLTPSGHFLGEAYFGGNLMDKFSSIAVDTTQLGCNMYVSGETKSDMFFYTRDPVQKAYGGGTGDALLVRLCWDEVAPKVWDFWTDFSTYLGGSNWDKGKGVSFSNGIVWVAGTTNSDDLPAGWSCPLCARTGMLDAFVAAFQP